MFDNIGSKIKSLAMVLFILGVIASIVSAIYLFLIDEDLLGVRNLFLGPIFSYLSVLVLYGFGEIITKLTEIEKNTRSTPQPEKYSPENWSNAEPKRTSDYVNTEKGTIVCANCSCKQPATRTTCWHCGTRLED